MTYRVIQWGTGNVGKHSLRAIIGRPDLELVGLKVYSDSKVGVDAGDLVGGPKTGILAIKDVDRLLEIDADVVVYNPLGVTLADLSPIVSDICMLLSRGYNVASSAIETAIYPPALVPEVLDQIREACEKGKTSFLAGGINPGFGMDLLPVYLSRLSRTIHQIRCLEVCDMVHYSSKANMMAMGFCQTPEQLQGRGGRMVGRHPMPFYASLLMLADAYQFELEAVRFETDYGYTDKPIEVAIGTIETGTAAVVKLRFIGEAYGRDVLVNEWVWRCSQDIKPEWGTGEYWSVEIKGDPELKLRLDASTEFDSKRNVSITVATNVVNSIPGLCDSSPGVKSALDLPICVGGMVTR